MTATELDIRHGVGTITLNEPDNRNALSQSLIASLQVHLTACLDREDVRSIVVTNAGRVFCAGADLKARSAAASGDAPGSQAMVDAMMQIRESPKPTIARIDGHCAGGGVGLAAAFDISVARDDVTFGFTEVRLGVAPAIISVVCLPKMRLADSQELFLRGNRFDADHAARVGLINYSVPTDQLDSQIAEITADVARGGPQALATAKQVISRVPTLSTADAFAEMETLSSALFDSDEAAAGMAAFLAKDAAPWVPPELLS